MSDSNQPSQPLSIRLPRRDVLIQKLREVGGEDFAPLYPLIHENVRDEMNPDEIKTLVLSVVIAFLERYSSDPRFFSGRVGNLIPDLLRALMPAATEYSPTDMIPMQVALLLELVRRQLADQ